MCSSAFFPPPPNCERPAALRLVSPSFFHSTPNHLRFRCRPSKRDEIYLFFFNPPLTPREFRIGSIHTARKMAFLAKTCGRITIWLIRIFQNIFGLILIGVTGYMLHEFKHYRFAPPHEVVVPLVFVRRPLVVVRYSLPPHARTRMTRTFRGDSSIVVGPFVVGPSSALLLFSFGRGGGGACTRAQMKQCCWCCLYSPRRSLTGEGCGYE